MSRARIGDLAESNRSSRLLRVLATVASTAVVVAGLVAIDATAADALTLQTPTITYQHDVNGDYLLAGNGVLKWTGIASGSKGPSEDQLHNGVAGGNDSVNDEVVMGNNSDTHLPSAINGSSAVFTVPAGASIVQAQLYWAGSLGGRKDANGNVLSGYACSDAGAATLPATGDASTQTLQMKVGAASIQSVATANYLGETIAQTAAGNSNYYSARQDVTSIVQAGIGVSTGSAQTISVGNLWAPTGAGCFAGWSLALVYDFGRLVAGNAASAGRHIVLYSGHVRQATTDASTTIDFANFETLDTNSRLGVTLYEGDRNIEGDTVAYRAGSSGTFNALSNGNGINTTNNYGISAADGSVRYAGSGTGYFFNANVDVRNQALPLAAGSTSMQLQMSTSGDSYLWQNAVLSTTSAKVDIKKEALDGTDTQAVNVGGAPSFRITVTNNGSIGLGNITIDDPLSPDCARAAGASGVPTSLASLGTFTYTCTGPATTSGWTNTASVRAVAEGGSARVATSSDTSVVTVSQIALTKSGSVPTNATAGQKITYSFTATNTGSSTLTGVTITDPKPGVSGLTYTWPGVAQTLTPGQVATATATYTLSQADVDSGTITNTASVAASGPNSTTATATAPASVAVTANPLLTLTKTGVLNPAGTEITYSFVATNTGNLTLTGVAVTDPLLGAGSVTYGTWASGTTGTLRPGDAITGTATYAVTQADKNSGSVANTASVTGTPPRGTAPKATATATVAFPRTASIATTKTGSLANTGAAPKAGDIVTYSFTAKNTGNTTLTGVSIADPLNGLSTLTYGTWASAVTGTLQPGESVTATATYPLKQTDIDAGTVANTATSSATSPTGAVSSQGTYTLSVTRAPALSLTKVGALAGTGKPGDVITYTFTGTNSGNTTLTGVTISDPMADLSGLAYTWPGATGTLAPGQVVTAKATYTLKQSDVDAGSVINVASTSGTAPGAVTVNATAPGTVAVPQGPAITLDKTGKLSGAAAVGSTVTFTFVVHNTGNATLHSVGITDKLAGLTLLSYGAWPGAEATLEPGASVSATATYTLTQADLDRGSLTNDATVSGTSSVGTTVTDPDAATVTLVTTPGISVAKEGVLSGTGKAGDTITYTFTVRNTGATTLHDVSLADPKVGGPVELSGWPAATGVLAPNATATGQATYTLTQADVNAGKVDNTATATGTPPSGPAVTGDGTASVPITAAPAITLVKTASPATATAAGDEITYTFVATNSGNVTVTDVKISDPLAHLSSFTWDAWPGGASGTLQPGASIRATATYTLTQDDVNAGSVVNLATATGTPPTGTSVSGTDSATVDITRAPALTLTKTGVLSGAGAKDDVVTYSFRVKNSGNTTLTDVGISDPLNGLSKITFGAWPAPAAAGQLQPGQFVDATATYRLTQADVDLGRVENSATASGTPPSGEPVTVVAHETVDITAAPAVMVVKSGALAGGSAPKVGDHVTYSFSVSNTGNVTLHDVAVSDLKARLSEITFADWPGAEGVLAPGESVEASATYELTQADVDAGVTSNTASASAVSPTDVVVRDTDDADVPLVATPAIEVEKSASLSGDAVAGDEVKYTFTVRNTGNVTLHSVALTDPLISGVPLTLTWPDGAGVLAPQQSASASATHVLTQAEVDAGKIANTASVTGAPPVGDAVTDDDTVTTPLTAAPSVTLTKTGSESTTGRAGESITYTFLVKNTGNVTLGDIVVADPKVADISYAWPDDARVLAPGESVTATGTYALTQADVDAGQVKNTATASATPPTGPAVTGGGSSTVTIAAAPKLSVAKSHTLDGDGAPGDVITYSFLISNDGNVTLHGVILADLLPGLGTISFPTDWSGTLAPAQTVTATATYTLTQADVDAGSVVNTAKATGTPPLGDAVSGTGSDTVTTPFAPAIEVVKSGAAKGDKAGDAIDYTFTVTNTGNTTLTGVALSDPKVGGAVTLTGWAGTAGTLAPGASVTGAGSYTLTQADVNAGTVANTASVTAKDRDGADVSDTGSVDVTIAPRPTLTLEKTGALVSPATGAAGDTVKYSFRVVNTGNVTVTDVAVADPLVGLSPVSFPTEASAWTSGVVGTLQPGEAIVGTATYALTQADVDLGRVDNTATATVKDPSGQERTTTGTERVMVAAAPRVQVVKTGVLEAGTPVVGSKISYSFEISNLGNVTLTGVALQDGLPGLGTVAYDWPGADGVLAPNATATGTATYTLTQQDIDSGSVANSAIVSARPPVGDPVTGGDISTVPLAGTPSIAVVKSSSPASITAAGQVVTYSFEVKNTGNVTLSGVKVVDPLSGLSEVTFPGAWPSGTEGVLAPGDVVTATATYTVKQSDVDAGELVNTATAQGTPPAGLAVSGEGAKTITITPTPSIALSKEGQLQAAPVVGTQIRYAFRLSNTGNVTLTDVALEDLMPGLTDVAFNAWPTAESGTLRPGESVTAEGFYALTQDDVDAGSVVNTATASAHSPQGAPTSATTPATVVIPSGPAIELKKTASVSGEDAHVAGDIVTFTFVVRNTGNVKVSGVSLSDMMPGLTPLKIGPWPGGTDATLEPAQQVTATAEYTLTQADVDRGSVANDASASAQPPTGDPVTDTAVVDVALAAHPELSVVKKGQLGDAVVGGQIDYSFTVTNTGNVTMTDVALDDALVGGPVALGWKAGQTVGVLAPGEQVSGSALYTLTQADVDRGSVENTATGTGTAPGALTPTAGKTTIVTDIPAAASIALVKTGVRTGTSTPKAGDLMTYTFTVTNTGNVTLEDVGVTDPIEGLSTITFGTWTSGVVGVLAPDGMVTATATYTLTQHDIDSGVLVNTATAQGTPPTGPAVKGDGESTMPLAGASSVSFVKSASTGATKVGDTVTFTFTATNTGNLTLHDVSFADPMEGLSKLVYGTWPGAEGVLAPKKSVTATATYVLTQADVDAGGFVNAATLSVTSPSGPAVEVPGEAKVIITPAPAIDLVKTAALAGTGAVGDTITYTFAVANRGNVTLSDVSVTDTLPRLSAITYGPWPGAKSVLAPAQSVTATATYTLTQADVDAGEVVNSAEVSARTPAAVLVSKAHAVTTDITPTPAISLSKSGALAGPAAAGSVMTYRFTATNTGNVSLSSVAVSDEMAGLSSLTYGAWPGAKGVLAAGQSVTATATYRLTQTDVDRGSVVNAASVSGRPPTGAAVSGATESTMPLAAAPAMAFVKSASTGAKKVGDTVTFTFAATNTGNVTLRGVSFADPMAGLSAISYTWPGAKGVLAPSQSVKATATYVLTQADVDAGSIVNAATVSANPPSGPVVAVPGQATVVIASAPAIALSKVGVLAGPAAVGSVITYTFTATNTGNVSLSDVAVSDEMTGLSALTFGAWPSAEGELASGESVTATATYTLTQADVDRGSVSNTAAASAAPPVGDPVSVEDTETVPMVAAPAISLDKTATYDGGSRPGDIVSYGFTITNTGNVTLSSIGISDALPGLSDITYGAWPSTPYVLHAGQTVSATATYALTQADVDAGAVKNTATVTSAGPGCPDPSGVEPGGAKCVVQASDTANVALVSDPSMTFHKTVDRTRSAGPGTTLTYTFTVVNTGNVTLTGVAIADPLPGLSAISYGAWPSGTGVLAPGETLTATATYVVTAADGAAGKLVNSAKVTAVSPGGSPAAASDSVEVKTVPLPNTGGALDPTVPLGGALMILLGLGVFLVSRKRKENA